MPGIIVNSCGEKSLESDVVCHHLKWILCVVFTFCILRGFIAPIAVIGSSKTVMKVQFSQLFCQLETFRFVFYASHCSVSPQVWPWLRSRSVRFTKNKHFFLASGIVSMLLWIWSLKNCFRDVINNSKLISLIFWMCINLWMCIFYNSTRRQCSTPNKMWILIDGNLFCCFF